MCCPECGTENRNTAKFCNNCGARLSDSQAQAAPQNDSRTETAQGEWLTPEVPFYTREEFLAQSAEYAAMSRTVRNVTIACFVVAALAALGGIGLFLMLVTGYLGVDADSYDYPMMLVFSLGETLFAVGMFFLARFYRKKRLRVTGDEIYEAYRQNVGAP